MIKPDFSIRRTVCEACDKPIDSLMQTSGKGGPVSGSFCVCCWCAAISKFDDNLTLKLLTDDDLIKLFDEDRPTLELLLKNQLVIAKTRGLY